MAATGVFGLTRFTGLAAGDVLPAVDISDSTQNAHGSLDAITVTNFFASVPVPVVVTSASANALAVGLAGASNSAFLVDCSTALQVAGLKVTGAVTGGTVAVVVTDSGLNASLTVNAKGSGTIGIGSVSTGRVTITPVTTITGSLTLSAALVYGGVTLSNAVTGTGNMVLSAGPTFTGTITAAIANFSGAVSTAGLTCTTLAGTGAVSGFTSAAFSSTVTVTSNSADMVLNGSSGATSNVERLLFQRGGANKWRVGVNMEGGNADVFGVFSDAAGIYAITASAATGNIFFGASATVTSGFTVSAGTTAVQALTATSGTFSVGSALPITLNRTEVGAALMGMIVIERASTVKGYIGLSAGDLISFIDSSATFNNFTISDAGAGTFRAGISCTTGTFSTSANTATGSTLVNTGAGPVTLFTAAGPGTYIINAYNTAGDVFVSYIVGDDGNGLFGVPLPVSVTSGFSAGTSSHAFNITNTSGTNRTLTWSYARIN